MTSLSEKQGTYVALRVSKESAEALQKHCRASGITMSKSDLENRLHCTVIYSRIPCPDFKPDPTRIYVASFVGYELFDSDDGKALVVVLNAPGVLARHIQIRAEHGASHDHPLFTPHVTLTYDYKGETTAGIETINFPILLTDEYAEDLK